MTMKAMVAAFSQVDFDLLDVSDARGGPWAESHCIKRGPLGWAVLDQ